MLKTNFYVCVIHVHCIPFMRTILLHLLVLYHRVRNEFKVLLSLSWFYCNKTFRCTLCMILFSCAKWKGHNVCHYSPRHVDWIWLKSIVSQIWCVYPPVYFPGCFITIYAPLSTGWRSLGDCWKTKSRLDLLVVSEIPEKAVLWKRSGRCLSVRWNTWKSISCNFRGNLRRSLTDLADR